MNFIVIELLTSTVTPLETNFTILQKIIKVLHEKILKAINLYRFQNGALEKTNSLNGHYNEAGVNG